MTEQRCDCGGIGTQDGGSAVGVESAQQHLQSVEQRLQRQVPAEGVTAPVQHAGRCPGSGCECIEHRSLADARLTANDDDPGGARARRAELGGEAGQLGCAAHRRRAGRGEGSRYRLPAQQLGVQLGGLGGGVGAEIFGESRSEPRERIERRRPLAGRRMRAHEDPHGRLVVGIGVEHLLRGGHGAPRLSGEHCGLGQEEPQPGAPPRHRQALHVGPLPALPEQQHAARQVQGGAGAGQRPGRAAVGQRCLSSVGLAAELRQIRPDAGQRVAGPRTTEPVRADHPAQPADQDSQLVDGPRGHHVRPHRRGEPVEGDGTVAGNGEDAKQRAGLAGTEVRGGDALDVHTAEQPDAQFLGHGRGDPRHLTRTGHGTPRQLSQDGPG